MFQYIIYCLLQYPVQDHLGSSVKRFIEATAHKVNGYAAVFGIFNKLFYNTNQASFIQRPGHHVMRYRSYLFKSVVNHFYSVIKTCSLLIATKRQLATDNGKVHFCGTDGLAYAVVQILGNSFSFAFFSRNYSLHGNISLFQLRLLIVNKADDEQQNNRHSNARHPVITLGGGGRGPGRPGGPRGD